MNGPDPTPPSLGELQAVDAELVDGTSQLRAALAQSARFKAKLGELAELSLALGEKALDGLAERAPEIVARTVSGLLLAETERRLGH